MMAAEEYRVKAASDPQTMAGALAAGLRRDGSIRVVSVGMGAVHVATKALAMARGYLLTSGEDLRCVPSFRTVYFADSSEERTGIVWDVEMTKKEKIAYSGEEWEE